MLDPIKADSDAPEELPEQEHLRMVSGVAAAADTGELTSRLEHTEHQNRQQAILITLVAEILDAKSLEHACDALTLALQIRFKCDRVALALSGPSALELKSVSQQAVVHASSSEARLLLDAMEEACDQESLISWPSSDDSLGVLTAHRTLAGRRAQNAICSVPLYANGALIGAVLLERRNKRAFPAKLLEQLSLSIAPLLKLRSDADQGLMQVAARKLRVSLSRYLGADRPGMRALVLCAALGLVSTALIPMPWQVIASAELLPSERRLITVPQSGFVEKVLVSSGDVVEKGQLLATLDDQDLVLEAASSEGEVAVAEAEFRAALASYDRQATGISRARLAQIRARRQGIENRLERLDMRSPISGIVIAAVSEQANGSAVERGETLFEIAPDDDYIVSILVNEADIHNVFTGQQGELSLKATPGEHLQFTVSAIHPVAEATGGASRFRVRAAIVNPPSALHPGQSGVARLEAGTLSVLGVMTRRLNRRVSELVWRFAG